MSDNKLPTSPFQDDGDPHYIPPSNIVALPPRYMSFNKGVQAGEEAAFTGQEYLTAYSLAVADSVHYEEPMAFVRGFTRAYHEQETKLLVY